MTHFTGFFYLIHSGNVAEFLNPGQLLDERCFRHFSLAKWCMRIDVSQGVVTRGRLPGWSRFGCSLFLGCLCFPSWSAWASWSLMTSSSVVQCFVFFSHCPICFEVIEAQVVSLRKPSNFWTCHYIYLPIFSHKHTWSCCLLSPDTCCHIHVEGEVALNWYLPLPFSAPSSAFTGFCSSSQLS